MRYYFYILLTIVLLTCATPVSAQQSTPQPDDVNRVASQLYCPVCENTPLDVCPTQACIQWRALIREKLAAGWTDDQIKQYFAAQYGNKVLAEPPSPLVYIIPPVLFLLGALVLVQALRIMRRKPSVVTQAPVTPPADAVQDPYLSRVEEELKKRN